MTVTSSPRIAGPYTGMGAAASLPFAFKVFTASDLLVTRDGMTLALGADYTVSLNSDQDEAPGGAVAITATAYPLGSVVWLGSNIPVSQGTSLPSMGPWLPKVIESALDKVTILVQQLLGTVSRAVLLPVGDSAGVLPIASARAGMYLGFDAGTGALVTMAGTASVSDAAAVAYHAAQTGAIARSIADVLNDTLDPKNLGAVGDGVHPSADQAGFQAAITADIASNQLPLGASSTIKVNKGIIIPPGVYDAGNFSFSGGAPVRMAALIPGTVVIRIPAGQYFINQSGNPFSCHFENIIFIGGLGTLNAQNTGTNVSWGAAFINCAFYNYTECAIGNQSSDSPFLKVKNCFFGTSAAPPSGQVIGICWGGFGDEMVVEDCAFGGNSYHIAIGPRLSGHISITRNYFQSGDNATNGARCLADIWIKPNASGVTNSGFGTYITYNKFGNELQNSAYPAPNILVASEDTSAGAYRAQYKPLTTTAGDVGFVSGIHMSDNRINHLSPWNAPVIRSYVSSLAAWLVERNTFEGGNPSYMVEFPNARNSDYSNNSSIFKFDNSAFSAPLLFANRHFCQLEDRACNWPGDPNSVHFWGVSDDPTLSLITACLSGFDMSYFSGSTSVATADPYGTMEYASVIGGAYTGFTDPYAGSGGPIFVEVCLARPASQALTQVFVDVVNTSGSAYALKTLVSLPATGVFGRFTVPVILPANANPGSWQARVYGQNVISGTSDTFVCGDLIVSKGRGRFGRARVLAQYLPSPRNQRLVGGAQNTWPTGWSYSVANGTLSGVTVTVNRVSTDAFGDFVEIALTGTSTSAGNLIFRFDPQRSMDVVYGSNIRAFVGVRLMSGNLSTATTSTGRDGSTGPCALGIASHGSNDVQQQQAIVCFTPTTTYQVFGRTMTTSGGYFNGSVDYGWALFALGYPSGVATNVTFRLYAPTFQRSK